ncbi:MAG: DnaB-like helicase N-terminal domain-containing protein, partial [Pseudomonadota bacterium]
MREMADLFEPSGGATSMTAPMPGPECGPVNLEAEQALLGAILIENAALERITWFMKADYFAEPIHTALYEAAERLIAAGKVANPITVKAFLPETKIGEISVTDYCVRLVSGAPGTAHAKDYAALIAALHYRREMIEIADNMAREARSAPPDIMVKDLLKNVDHSIDSVREKLIFERDRKTMLATGDTLIAALSDAYKKGTPDGISWPFQSIAEIVSGPMEFGNLYKLIGSPKEGKTSFTLHVVRHALDAGHPVLILTFDQTADQVLLQMA